MQREDAPDTAAVGGLSTEDLAHPRDTYTPRDTANTSAEVPTFPGESTDTPSEAGEDEPTGAGPSTQDEVPQLLTPEDEEGFRTRWQEVQNEFVDDPRDAVHTADALVAEVMQKLAATFADHRQELEGQWNRGEEADTEDLRLALRHYRSFFNRLLVT
ncbi:hypothetical protein ACW4TU_43565 [Streptomyces sp. QTS52]